MYDLLAGLIPGLDTWLIALSFVAPALLVVLAARHISARGDKALAAFAASGGHPFYPDGQGAPDIMALKLPGTPALTGAEYRNYLKGPETADWKAHYADVCLKSGRAASAYSYFTFALFELKRRELPAFLLRPESLGDRLPGGDDGGDIDIPGQAMFSSAYHLQGPDRDAAAALGAHVADFMAERRGWSISGAGKYLLLYRRDSGVGAGGYAGFISGTAEIAGVFLRAARDRAY